MSEEISEQAKASTIAMILLALNTDRISKDSIAWHVQFAINSATDERDKEIARLKELLRELANQCLKAHHDENHGGIEAIDPELVDKCNNYLLTLEQKGGE